MTTPVPHIAIIGAGIGGLAAALRLAHTGAQISVFEAQATPGGKMRTLPSTAGPVDAGPTVLTLAEVFEELFAETGSPLTNHVTLHRENTLARHFWRDGMRLDLVADPAANVENIAQAFGPDAAQDFRRFQARTRTLFEAFEAPMMRAPAPTFAGLATRVLRQPALIARMEGHRSLAASLKRQFRAPKLAQLFGRYATYVGGIPQQSPALLSLIWQAEARGVWYVEGGMHALARAIEARARALGAQFHYSQPVTRIEMGADRPTAIHTPSGRHPIDALLFNGDPRALSQGLLGPGVQCAVPDTGTEPRSLSAHVQTFAADATGFDLAAHNVFFCDDPADEFGPLARDLPPRDATLYLCAQDRFGGHIPDGPERMELITNAPPAPEGKAPSPLEISECHQEIMTRLARFGLHLNPPADSLTTPHRFAQLFPGSRGSLYGRSPQGMMAALQRPTARTAIPGLYLAGGGAHPGAGVPMATLSAAHAAAAMIADLSLTSTSRPAAMPGGTSTGSRTMAAAPSRSLPS
ncbi:MAG: FAD-dependent oxidoreductase [Sulfitobacter sp.]|nr:FAD-dependent oxidoreductase [Sulfitobacter sp.]